LVGGDSQEVTMTLKTLPWSMSLVAALLWGCAHAPPAELASAQAAYYRASSGPAAQVVPDELHKAQLALGAAERAAHDEPGAQATLDLIYVAQRKAELAEARAQLELARRQKLQADASYTRNLAQKEKSTEAELAREREQRSAAQAQAAEARAATSEANAKLEVEAQARADAERKADAVAQDLAKIAQLREEDRGMVIALPGDLLFATDQAVLLSSAQLKLSRVADALRDSSERLIIEGHTDSRGADSYNMDLSRRRAEAVRDYLVGRGVAADRISVMAYGKNRPIADNMSAEGRANNRRVEIVLEGKHTAHR
jgi:outer membrane protein OmpA-like peptidoglycan-associated protein